MKVVVVQKGAREHFLAARALQREGSLACLVVGGHQGHPPGITSPPSRLMGWVYEMVEHAMKWIRIGKANGGIVLLGG